MMYVITVNQLAQAINNKERIRPQNLVPLLDMDSKPDASTSAENGQENAENGLLYPDTDKELFFSDYRPLPSMKGKTACYPLFLPDIRPGNSNGQRNI